MYEYMENGSVKDHLHCKPSILVAFCAQVTCFVVSLRGCCLLMQHQEGID